MLIKIIAVGKIKDHGLQSKIDEFTKWISRYAKLEIIELRDSTIEKEGTAIIKALGREKAFIFALSEEGKQFTSNKFSQKMANIDQKLIFITGGPFGLSPAVKQCANCLFSLSKMTFTHEMARLFLLEQIYRGIDIARGGKYHNN